MAEPAWPFVGTEALANGVVNRGRVGKRSPPSSPPPRWTGSLWIDAKLPAELNQRSRHKTKGIVLHSDELGDDEVCIAGAVPATTPARTAFDLGRRNRLTPAVIRLDALMRATHLKAADVEVLIERHRGARGIVSLRKAISLADAGAESPQETRTRLVLTFAGLRPQRTQIEVFDTLGHFVGRNRSLCRVRGAGMADQPRQRRRAAIQADHDRRAHPRRGARRRRARLVAEREPMHEISKNRTGAHVRRSVRNRVRWRRRGPPRTPDARSCGPGSGPCAARAAQHSPAA